MFKKTFLKILSFVLMAILLLLNVQGVAVRCPLSLVQKVS